LPLASNAAKLFLNECLQKMPQHRRHCGSLLLHHFIDISRTRPPTLVLDWILDPTISLSPPLPPAQGGQRTGSEQEAEAEGQAQAEACDKEDADGTHPLPLPPADKEIAHGTHLN